MTNQEFWAKVKTGEIYPDGWFKIGTTEAYKNNEDQSFGHRFEDDTIFTIIEGEMIELEN